MQHAVHRLAALRSLSVLCAVLGIAGGLLLGWVLSRSGGWLTPLPWAIYLAALLVVIAAISMVDARRTEAAIEPWTLRPEDVLGAAPVQPENLPARGDEAPVASAESPSEQHDVAQQAAETLDPLPVELGAGTLISEDDADV